MQDKIQDIYDAINKVVKNKNIQHRYLFSPHFNMWDIFDKVGVKAVLHELYKKGYWIDSIKLNDITDIKSIEDKLITRLELAKSMISPKEYGEIIRNWKK